MVEASPRRIFANAHTYHINSISINSDQETYLSADDLRINLWHMEVTDQVSCARQTIQPLLVLHCDGGGEASLVTLFTCGLLLRFETKEDEKEKEEAEESFVVECKEKCLYFSNLLKFRKLVCFQEICLEMLMTSTQLGVGSFAFYK